jgi:acetyl esterase/lipase
MSSAFSRAGSNSLMFLGVQTFFMDYRLAKPECRFIKHADDHRVSFFVA